jgi:CheY-like chemotaxis protein
MLGDAGVTESGIVMAPERDGLRVLIVDDSRYVLRAARSLLETMPRIGHVVTAYSGLSALDLAMKQAFDLVILDLAMTGVNGLEVARRLRSMARSPRIVMVSFYDEPEFEAAAAAAGADVLIHKPSLGVKLEPLIEALFGPRD